MKQTTVIGGKLDAASLERGTRWLTRRDADLRRIVRRHGPPPLWGRPGGFRTLVQIILEQQVSLAAGQAALARIEARFGRVTAPGLAIAGPEGLRAAGITRQKSAYLADLAAACNEGTLDLRRLARLPDDEVRRTLTAYKGIGRWTADVYLLMAMRRPDAWPPGDLALQKALQWCKGFPERPVGEEELAIAAVWSPWRGVAARILWHGYLAGKRHTAAADPE
jgi:DNA-3-methyladenine glycosylase II